MNLVRLEQVSLYLCVRVRECEHEHVAAHVRVVARAYARALVRGRLLARCGCV